MSAQHTPGALKPCPFCGGEGCMTAIGNGDFVIRCRSCAAEGPWGKSCRSAEGWWNRRDDDLRDALTRAVVAEQWAVAIALCDPLLWALGESSIEWPGAHRFAALPSAAAVVAERMGEP